MTLLGKHPKSYNRVVRPYGHISQYGYRTFHPKGDRTYFEQDIVWQKFYGRPIPDGVVIHHIDGNKLNNDPLNLIDLTTEEHRRIESGWKQLKGVWYKTCKKCKQFLTLDNFHKQKRYDKEGTYSTTWLCKPCLKMYRKEINN